MMINSEREIQKISMNVLQDQRKFSLAAIVVTRLAYGTCRRVGPKRFVISAAIVVAGEAKSAGTQRINNAAVNGIQDGNHLALARTMRSLSQAAQASRMVKGNEPRRR